MLLDDETNELAFMLVKGSLAADLKGYRIPANEGIAGWVIQQAEPTLVRDVRRDQRFSNTVDEAFKFRTQSIAAAPLIGDGKVYGLIEALNQPGDEPFSDSDLALLGLLCRFAGEALADIERMKPENA
jgi:GAF domain-containing protein